MAASWSGILTLVVLLVAGPLVWAVVCFVSRRKGLQDESPENLQRQAAQNAGEPKASRPPSEAAPHREEVSGASYLLGLLGYAIGIGNLWRFPFLVGRWGGAAFVIAYLVCLLFVSMPAFFLELVIGQYTRGNTINCFKTIHPRWTGLGYGQAFLLFFALSYYNILLAYSVIYTAGSLAEPLPWAQDSEAYWLNTVLNSYGGDYEGRGFGPVQWRLALALLFVWAVVFASLAFGKEILAKVTWVTVVGPCVLLFVVLCRALTLEGAGDGIRFYIGKFDAEVLGDLEMWAAACGQILFSLSPGFGTAITMSSYTRPNQNVFRTCVTVALANSSFSLIGGFAIFSMLGNIVHRINAAGGATTVEDQARSGPGLAFITIADGMQNFGAGSNVMSVLFFVMLFTLGLDSTFAWVETFVSYVEDFLQAWTKTKPSRVRVVGGVCLTFLLLGLFYCTRMGLELLDVVDHYVSGYYLLFGVAVEATLFTVDFGWRRLKAHVKLSTLGNASTPSGQDVVPEWFWRLVIPTTVPSMSLGLLLYLLYADLGEAYEGYPDWMQAIGWTILVVNLAIMPAGGLWQWKRHRSSALPPVEEDELRLEGALAARAAPQQAAAWDTAPGL